MTDDAKIYRSILSVAMEVSMEAAARDPKIREHVARHAVEEMVHMGAEKYLVFIRPESVRLSSVRPVEGTNDSIYRFVWHPSTADGVEFVGGPLDGEVMSVPMDHGWAVEFWNVHVRQPLVIGRELDMPPTTMPKDIALYRRDGIDRIRDRWVYQFEGMH